MRSISTEPAQTTERSVRMNERKLKNEEIGSLCAALAHLIHAGIGNGDALMLLWQDEQNGALKDILKQMAAGADDGKPLSALFAAAGCFPAYVCTLLEVAEGVGQSEQVLRTLGQYYDRRSAMNRRIRANLMYPAVLLAVLLAVIVILLIWVLPVFDQVYARLGSGLTGAAGGLLVFGNILRKVMPVLCALVAAGLLMGAIAPVRRKVLRFAGSCWGDRGVFGKINAAGVIQALSLALAGGLSPQEGVRLASRLSGDEAPAFRRRCGDCLACLDEGKSLSQALRETELLDASRSRLLEAGIRSGRTEQVLDGIAQELLDSGEEALERKVSGIEPVMIAAACVLIGAVLLSVMLPLVNIMNGIG